MPAGALPPPPRSPHDTDESYTRKLVDYRAYLWQSYTGYPPTVEQLERWLVAYLRGEKPTDQLPKVSFWSFVGRHLFGRTPK